MSILKAAVLGVMIPLAVTLPAAAQDGPGSGQPGGPRMIFEELDLDADGVVTLEEVEGAREAQFAMADLNGDGTLDREELLAAAAERAALRIDRMIERIDGNGDGAISREEMADARGGRRGPDAERMFERFDADGDGAVTEAEFDAALAELRDRRGGRFDGRGHGRGHGHGFFRDRG